jgi:hypothetical protein
LLSHQRNRKKKGPETCLWKSIWGCGSPACYCQPAFAGGFIDCWPQVSLTFTKPNRLCLFKVLLVATATVPRFPLSKHTGGSGATPAFSSRFVYLQFTWEVPLPHFPVELFSQQSLL